MPFHVAGHGVGPVLVGGTHREHARQALGILAQQGIVASGAEGLPQGALGRIERGVVEAVVGRHAGAPVAHQVGVLETREVGGDARLGEAGDGRQLGDRELLDLQQCKQAHAGRIGKRFQAGRPGFEVHEYLRIAIQR